MPNQGLWGHMSIWSAPSRTNRADCGIRAALLAFVAAFLLAACTSAPTEDATPSLAASPPSSPTAAAASPSPTEDLPAEALSAYRDYLSALTGALAAGDPEAPQLAERADGPALEVTRQQLQANVTDGLIATGTIQPAATSAEVTIDGDRANVQDCLLNDLAQVRAGDTGEVVQAANGNRQPLTATLTRGEDGWVVSEVVGPELRGPVLGGESCAPPTVEQTLLTRYEAFWDALYAAGDPGGGQAANPDSPALAETMIDPQLADTRAGFAELRTSGQVLRGRPDTGPVVLGLFEYDQLAVVLDCVITPAGSGVYDLAANQPVGDVDLVTRTLDSTQMRVDSATWKVANWDIGEVQECAQPDE